MLEWCFVLLNGIFEQELTQAQTLGSTCVEERGDCDRQEKKERCKSDGGFDTMQQKVQTRGLEHEERGCKHRSWRCEVGRELVRKVSTVAI